MCRDPWTREHLPDLVRGRLSVEETGRAVAHLDECRQCAAERALIVAMGRIEVPDPGDGFWLDLPEKVMKGARERKGARRQWFGGLAVAAVAAALVLFFLVPGTPPVDRIENLSGMGPLSLVDLGPEQDLLSHGGENTLAVEAALDIEVGLTEEEVALISPIPADGELEYMLIDPDTINELERAIDEMSNRG
ncbi:MAG: zf-HC2 domain-containing protein [Deltaproteobacteria bacterium]|nr:zf-HC2 domain-containing protein [Deltaproteobacteria bacterium]